MKNQIYYITDRYGQRLSAVLPIRFFEDLMECYEAHRDEFLSKKAATQEQDILTQAKKELNLLVNEYENEMTTANKDLWHSKSSNFDEYSVNNGNKEISVSSTPLGNENSQNQSSIQMMQSRSEQLIAESTKEEIVSDDSKALDKILHYRSGNARAMGYLTVHGGRYGFILLKGSTIKKTRANTVRGSAIKLIEILVNEGKLVDEGELYRFVHNTEVQSCSLAASLVAGNNRGMINTWRDDDGNTLEYYGFSKHKNLANHDEQEFAKGANS